VTLFKLMVVSLFVKLNNVSGDLKMPGEMIGAQKSVTFIVKLLSQKVNIIVNALELTLVMNSIKLVMILGPH
jgi:hypothetical protein